MLWLRKFTSENLIKGVKPKARMLTILQTMKAKITGFQRNSFALQTMANAGFLQHLLSTAKCKSSNPV